MTDIVKRLRGSRPIVGANIPGIAKIIAATPPGEMLVMLEECVLAEAADEIDRLRADCDRLREFNTRLCAEIERMGGSNRRVPQCETDVASIG